MKTVTFKNRNGLAVSFEPHGDNHMKFDCPDSHYWRFGHGNPTGIGFVDPEGGPFVAVGDNLQKHHHSGLPDKVVASIENSDHGIYLTLKDDNRTPEVQLPEQTKQGDKDFAGLS